MSAYLFSGRLCLLVYYDDNFDRNDMCHHKDDTKLQNGHFMCFDILHIVYTQTHKMLVRYGIYLWKTGHHKVICVVKICYLP